MEFIEFAKYGLTGVAILSIIALILFVKWMFKLVGNHMHDVSEAIRENTKVLAELKELIQSKL